MKRSLLLIFISILFLRAGSQELSVKELILSLGSSQKKLESYLNKRNFLLSDSKWSHDTLINVYSWKAAGKKQKEKEEEPIRKIEIYGCKTDFSFSFFTSSKTDFTNCILWLKAGKFFCGENKPGSPLLFQKGNVTVEVTMARQCSADTIYCFWFKSVNLPSAKDIRWVDDLMQFNSHEQLVAVFGQQNVAEDIYFFSDNKISKCSVLFPRTGRQAVFIWADEENLRQPDDILIGGNVKTGSSANFDGWIEENTWTSRQGIFSGMKLNDLIKLNGNDFKFYGVRSKYPFWVVPENTGTLDFKKIKVVLGCLNESSSSLLQKEMVSASEILDDNTGLYVLMLVLSPQASSTKK